MLTLILFSADEVLLKDQKSERYDLWHGLLYMRLMFNLKNNTMNTLKKNLIEVSDADFDTTIKEGVVLVDFWASWCAPCRMQSPILDEVAQSFVDKAVIAKVNVDYNRKSAEKYQIMSIPTLVLFKDGKPVKQFVGVQSKETLEAEISKVL